MSKAILYSFLLLALGVALGGAPMSVSAQVECLACDARWVGGVPPTGNFEHRFDSEGSGEWECQASEEEEEEMDASPVAGPYAPEGDHHDDDHREDCHNNWLVNDCIDHDVCHESDGDSLEEFTNRMDQLLTRSEDGDVVARGQVRATIESMPTLSLDFDSGTLTLRDCSGQSELARWTVVDLEPYAVPGS